MTSKLNPDEYRRLREQIQKSVVEKFQAWFLSELERAGVSTLEPSPQLVKLLCWTVLGAACQKLSRAGVKREEVVAVVRENWRNY